MAGEKLDRDEPTMPCDVLVTDPLTGPREPRWKTFYHRAMARFNANATLTARADGR